jgi:dolichyl-phosphate beta-glucosyltransferase
VISDDVQFEPPSHAPEAVEVSIVVPAFNESKRISAYLLTIHAYFLNKKTAHEILVVNDGSHDATAQTIRELMKTIPTLGLLTYACNRGKGLAVRLGMLRARGLQRIFADADGSTPISEIEKLQARLSDGSDIAIGSRAPQEGTVTVIRPHRRVIAAAFRLLRNILLPLDVVDSQCGFKLFTAAAAQTVFGPMKIDGMAFDVEALYLARRSMLKVAEVPVNWTDSYPSTIRLWSDPFKMARDLIRIRRIHRT